MVSGCRIAVLTASLVAGLAVCPAAHADCALPMPERIARVSRPITPVDLVRLRDIGVPDSTFFNMPSPLALSPDDREVAFVLSQADPVTNSYCRRLMVAAVEPDASPRTLDEGGDLILLKDDYRGLLVTVGFPEIGRASCREREGQSG